jgi:hypothetical protein
VEYLTFRKISTAKKKSVANSHPFNNFEECCIDKTSTRQGWAGKPEKVSGTR